MAGIFWYMSVVFPTFLSDVQQDVNSPVNGDMTDISLMVRQDGFFGVWSIPFHWNSHGKIHPFLIGKPR